MKFLSAFIFSMLGMAVFFQPAKCLADVLVPAELNLFLKEGDEFNLDLFFMSQPGGIYYISAEIFEYDAEENKVFDAKTPEFIKFSEDTLDLKPGEKKVFHASGIIDESVPQGDMYVSIFVKRKIEKNAPATYQLASLLFFQIGDHGEKKSELNIRDVTLLKKEKDVDGVEFTIKNNQELFDVVKSSVDVYDAKGNLLVSFPGDEFRLFQNVEKTFNSYFFYKENYLTPDDAKNIIFILRNSNGEVVYQKPLFIYPGDVFLAKQKAASPVDGELKLKIEEKFVWTDWILHYVVALVGLCLVFYALYNKK